jgi:hypothetical protein
VDTPAPGRIIQVEVFREGNLIGDHPGVIISSAKQIAMARFTAELAILSKR